MQIYLVGGAVRDALLGRPVKDRDWVVVGATPEDMTDRGYRQVGADFPVFLHPETGEEYALARTERKQGHGYHGFTVHSAPDVTLEEDLRRRDLTINAMAQSDDGTVIDPFNGQQDIEQRLLRHVSPAFAEDPLRILRVARFAARFSPLGFSVAKETNSLMRDMVRSGEATHLVPERIWQEMQRALLEASPEVFFQVLQDCGALAQLIPPLAAAMESVESIKSGATPQVINPLRAAVRISDAVAVRYAALVGSLGDVPTIDALSEKLKAPNDCCTLASLLAATAEDLLGDAAQDASLLIAVFDRADAWRRPDRFNNLLTAANALADARGVVFNQAPIMNALRAAKSVEPQALMAEGYTGKALGEAIRRTRHQRIAECIHAGSGDL